MTANPLIGPVVKTKQQHVATVACGAKLTIANERQGVRMSAIPCCSSNAETMPDTAQQAMLARDSIIMQHVMRLCGGCSEYEGQHSLD